MMRKYSAIASSSSITSTQPDERGAGRIGVGTVCAGGAAGIVGAVPAGVDPERALGCAGAGAAPVAAAGALAAAAVAGGTAGAMVGG